MPIIIQLKFLVPPTHSVVPVSVNKTQYNFLQSLFLLENITIRKKEEKKADLVKILQMQETWRYSFYWLLKDYLKQWKFDDFPFCTPEVRACLPFGNKRIATLRLCEKVLDEEKLSNSPEKLPYENALEFAGKLWAEEKLRNLLIAHQIEPNKKTVEGKLREEISTLKEWVNPYEGNPHCEHLSNLIATAIRIGERQTKPETASLRKRRENFRKEAWRPYLKAIANCLKTIRDGIKVEIDNKDIVYRFATPYVQGEALVAAELTQGGRGIQKIYAPSQKTFLSGRGRKSKIEEKITLTQQGLEPVCDDLKNDFYSARKVVYAQITKKINEDDKPIAPDQKSQ